MLSLEQNFKNFFGTAALPALDQILFDEYDQAEDPRSKIFNMETTDRELKQVASIASLGLLEQVNEGNQAPADSFTQSYKQNYSVSKYAKKIGITDEMISDDRYEMVSKMVKSLARSVNETKLVSAFSVLNNAFSAQTSYDGVALASASHPTLSGNQSNLLSASADLSYSSLAEAEQVFRQFKDERGKQMLIKPRILLVSESDRQNALEIVQSPYKANTANNNINALGADGGLMVISSPYLTDSDAWFLLSDPQYHGLRIVDHSDGIRTRSWEDIGAGVLYYKVEFREVAGADEWRGLVASPGA